MCAKIGGGFILSERLRRREGRKGKEGRKSNTQRVAWIEEGGEALTRLETNPHFRLRYELAEKSILVLTGCSTPTRER
jgi:hypothetical protein